MRDTVTLDDKYTEKSGRIYLNGLQALVRIPLMQHQLDNANGLKTGTFISGYRGSPLGGLDMALKSARKFLETNDIKFVPGINEDLGATAVWGSQQLNLGPGATYDGVVGMWYGKGPGVDRSVDVLKHANGAGSSKYGGVLALAGDDHACKSSTFPHQSEHAFMHAMIPVLHPAGIEDALNLGLHGIAMSRYSGCWTAFKIISDFADSSASVSTDPFALEFKTPTDFDMPKDGLNIRWYDPPVEQEERLIRYKLPAAQAYARANGLDRFIIAPAKKRLGIVATGKGWMDTMQALDDLGITKRRAEEMGIAVYKIALVWPLDSAGIVKLASEVEEIFVVEEKRGLIEEQIKKILFNVQADRRPRVTGKTDDKGAPLLPETYELSPGQIADALIKRLSPMMDTAAFNDRMAIIHKNFDLKGKPSPVVRMPWYCSGCPHNTSTVVPDGSRALAGIGCHYMAMWMDRSTVMFTQMGGEGVPWIGQTPFTDEKHVFTNLGDGTYFHSGLLAIRAACAANVNITYKILYNDAVAMTGGQHVDGELTVPMVADQVRAEGVKTIYVVSDDIKKYGGMSFPTGTLIEHRDNLDAVQRKLRETPGVTVLIYDQTCAAEKRRRRKRGLMEDPAKRIIINERVCEGCGDCGKKSNCLSVAPVETEFGRKRQIDQSTCNKDYSCVKGFCPSFVTVLGGGLKKPEVAKADAEVDAFFNAMPEPAIGPLDKPVAILVTGVGGTGVVTIGAILAMAAHLEDKGATTMDQTGLAQKGGAVTSHVRLAKTPEEINTVRIGIAGANVIIGADMLVTADGDCLSKIRPKGSEGETKIILNTHKAQTGEFTRKPDWNIPGNKILSSIAALCGENNLATLDATQIATSLSGDSIATNMFMLGYAWQMGYVPVGREAIMKAIELNGVSIPMNQQAFVWGRRAAWNLEKVKEIATPHKAADGSDRHRQISTTLEEVIDRRMMSLTGYQNAAYANKYKALVDAVREADIRLKGNPGKLTDAVARYYYKLMAYKDEYEVARLYTDGQFLSQLKNTFAGDIRLRFNMAPPLLAKRDAVTGHLKKMEFGPWVLSAFRVLATMRTLRGTPLDIFGYTAERKMERQLIKDYKKTLEDITSRLTASNYDLAVEIASIPEHIRGYGHVKDDHLKRAKEAEASLLEKFGRPAAPPEQRQAA
ncbi:MAG: indolepyruvate ferredoxin oxidoreductase family protein [Alphaproteobacteria bacterium]|nr:MAG: indolepyruvate ferredoxin oxidoreductase family protein [Alphaproteobacteria bacterium]